MNIHPIVINLDRRQDRYRAFASRYPLNHSRFSAFDGYDQADSMWDRLLLEGLRRNPHNPRLAMAGIYGCWRSHLALWQQLEQERKWDAYLILEDDVTLSRDFLSLFLNLEKNLTGEFDIHYLGGAIQEGFQPASLETHWEAVPQGELTVYRMHDRRWVGRDFGRGLYAYILTQQGARKLISTLIDSLLTNNVQLQAVDEWVNRNRLPLSVCDIFPHQVWVENYGRFNDSDVNPVEAARQRAK